MRAEDRYDSLFRFYAGNAAVDWLILKSQVKAESDFNPEAQSAAGALGLAQFMSGTFSEWAARLGIRKANAFNPEQSIQCQAAYMAWLRNLYAGNITKAAAAYNWGIGNMAPIAEREDWHKQIPDETREYLGRIERFYHQLRTTEV